MFKNAHLFLGCGVDRKLLLLCANDMFKSGLDRSKAKVERSLLMVCPAVRAPSCSLCWSVLVKLLSESPLISVEKRALTSLTGGSSWAGLFVPIDDSSSSLPGGAKGTFVFIWGSWLSDDQRALADLVWRSCLPVLSAGATGSGAASRVAVPVCQDSISSWPKPEGASAGVGKLIVSGLRLSPNRLLFDPASWSGRLWWYTASHTASRSWSCVSLRSASACFRVLMYSSRAICSPTIVLEVSLYVMASANGCPFLMMIPLQMLPDSIFRKRRAKPFVSNITPPMILIFAGRPMPEYANSLHGHTPMMASGACLALCVKSVLIYKLALLVAKMSPSALTARIIPEGSQC